jgi:uncharacterized paraquat-inducible protein A
MMEWRESQHDDDEIEETEEVSEGPPPDQTDLSSGDEPALVQCPFCKKYVSEEAERCHRCGNYITREDGPRRMPVWILVGAVLALLAVLYWSV